MNLTKKAQNFLNYGVLPFHWSMDIGQGSFHRQFKIYNDITNTDDITQTDDITGPNHIS